MQVLGTSGLAAVPQPLMQFPYSISKPGQLQGAKISGSRRKRLLKPDPVAQAASWV